MEWNGLDGWSDWSEFKFSVSFDLFLLQLKLGLEFGAKLDYNYITS